MVISPKIINHIINELVLESFDKLEEKISEFKTKHIKPAISSPNLRSVGTFVITELVVSISIGVFFGYNLDQYFHTKALFLFIFIILGLISSLYNIYRKLK